MREETLWRPLNPEAEEPRETQAAFQKGRCNPCPIYVLRRIWDQQLVQKLCHEITLWIGVVVPTSLQTRSRFGLADAQLTEMTGLMEGKIWPPFRDELLGWCVLWPWLFRAKPWSKEDVTKSPESWAKQEQGQIGRERPIQLCRHSQGGLSPGALAGRGFPRETQPRAFRNPSTDFWPEGKLATRSASPNSLHSPDLQQRLEGSRGHQNFHGHSHENKLNRAQGEIWEKQAWLPGIWELGQKEEVVISTAMGEGMWESWPGPVGNSRWHYSHVMADVAAVVTEVAGWLRGIIYYCYICPPSRGS